MLYEETHMPNRSEIRALKSLMSATPSYSTILAARRTRSATFTSYAPRHYTEWRSFRTFIKQASQRRMRRSVSLDAERSQAAACSALQWRKFQPPAVGTKSVPAERLWAVYAGLSRADA